MKSSTLSIVVPCYNPALNWLERIKHEKSFFDSLNLNYHLIIVNDGSTQNILPETVSQIKNLPNCTFISYENNKGKGFALRQGVKAAKGDFVIYTDIDFPYTHESFHSILNTLLAGADVVIGVRPAAYYESVPASRKFISKILRFFIRKLLAIPTDDTQCGLKGFNSKGKEVFLQTSINRYLFDMEFIKLSAKQKLTIKLCEVHLKPNLEMPAMPLKILLQESLNFLRIMFS
jgi:glycosyltransferase involved in cell wall biosynthesis